MIKQTNDQTNQSTNKSINKQTNTNKQTNKQTNNNNHNSIPDRQRLYYSWGSFGQFYKFQPLHLVRRYFGEKIAIYFAWLGFYTSFLLPVALLGVAVTIYGAVTVGEDPPTKEVCDQDGAVGKLVMCPQCRKPHCDYWPLSMRYTCAWM